MSTPGTEFKGEGVSIPLILHKMGSLHKLAFCYQKKKEKRTPGQTFPLLIYVGVYKYI